MSPDPDRRQFLRFIAEGTRPNQLYLKELKERNFGELSNIFAWFMNLVTLGPEDNHYFSHFIEQSEDVREFIADFLRNVDTGISDIGTIHSPTKTSELPHDAIAALKNMSIGVAQSGESVLADESSGDPEIVKIRLQHQGKNRKTSFNLNEESDGTRRLLALVPLLYMLKHSSGPVAVDELEHSLHPLLTSAFVRAFMENTPEGSTGQLIFTTHDTNLLDQALLPRDSTWFVEKDLDGASKLYSLAEYKSEHLDPLKSLERGYLQGRFGAIPIISRRAKLGARSAK
jgi:AAA15 family ATPase/GTPase